MSSLRKIPPFLRLFRRVLAGTVLLYVLTSLSIGGSESAKMVFHILAGTWVLVVSLGQLGIFRQLNSWPALRRFLQISELLATNLALTLILAEVALIGYGAWAGDSLLLQDTLDVYRLVPGKDYGQGLVGNSLGYPGRDFRLEKRPGTKRLAALGDSFAVGPVVPFAENYLSLVESGLPDVEVYNFGVSGTGPREYYAILHKDVWQFQPDLVLVSIFVGNDITETMATPRHLDPRSHALYLLVTRTWRLVKERLRRENPITPAAGERRIGACLSARTFGEVEGRRLAVCQIDPPISLDKKWASALGYLDQIIKDCRAHSVPVAFVLIPDEFQVNPEVWALAIQESRLDQGQLDPELPQRRLGQFFNDRDVPYLDLLPAFRGQTDTYECRDTHWNVRGNRLSASLIVPWLKSRFPTFAVWPLPPVP